MWFSGFIFLILSLIVKVYLWWKLKASLIFLSGRTCTIGGWLNTCLPHCMWMEDKWRISTWRQPLQPWTSAESRTHRWAPETDLQWGPRHLDIHRGKTPGTSGPLTLWLCCSWNKLLIRLAGGELAPRLSLVSPKVFSPFCHRWSFRSLPLSPLACLVGDTSLAAQSSTLLHRYYLNWTKLDNAITKFNNEMHSADNWVLNPVILHYWHNLPILILCSALLQFVLLKALYK